MFSALGTSSPPAGEDEAAALLHSCLSRLLVVHCSSSAQLLLTLHLLESWLASRPKLALLLLDSVSAFYWQDRYEGGASGSRREERLGSCAALLARLLRWVFEGNPLLVLPGTAVVSLTAHLMLM